MRSAALASLLLVVACTPLGVTNADAGDAGSVMGDAGTSDAGSGLDGGQDAGPRDGGDDDAGARSDAGDPTDAGPDGGDDGGTFDGGPDAGDADAGLDAGELADASVDLVTVTSTRELRGAWVSTVANLDWPLTQGLSADAGRASLELLVDHLGAAGFNALFFQVRPESDALYESALEPWSRFLTGTQGQSPGWDPLATLLSAAHQRGLEVHAWMNPYRGLSSPSVTTAPNHITRTLSAQAVTYNGQVVMNPGSTAVRTHVVDVVKDLLDRYDVDGLHFDDYFYPYPDSNGTAFPDDTLYFAYTGQGGTLSRGDWRRENVNALVRDVMTVIQRDHPHIRFGISPFGIYKSGTPAGISGLSGFDAIYCDSLKWMTQGWVDYLAPQLYWPITQTSQSYTTLATWWAGGATGGRHIFPGHATYQLGTTSAWSLSEYRNQLAVTRSLQGSGALGDVHFRTTHLLANRSGVLDALTHGEYSAPSLPPEVPRAGATTAPAPPTVLRSGSVVTLTTAPGVRFVVLYREVNGAFERVSIKGEATVTFTLAPGRWALTAVARGGAESRGVRLTIP